MSNYTNWVNFYEFLNIPINFIVLLWSKIYKEKVDNEMSNEDGYKNWYNFSSIHSAYLLPLRFLPSLWIFQRLFMHRPFAAAFEIDYTTIFTTYNFDITRFHIYQICGLPWRRELCQNPKLSKEIYIHV